MPKKSDEFTAIYINIGKKIDELRIIKGISRGELGKTVGVTFQQMAKYCNGSNRICSARLYALSKILNKPISYFFDEEEVVASSKHKRMAMDVSRNFMRITSESSQYAVNQLVRILAEDK